MRKNIKIILCIIVFSLAFNSCKESGNYQPISTKNKSNSNQETHKVIVEGVENAGMYTYVKVLENEKAYWIAIPQKEVNVGETYYYVGGMKMVNFKSTELNKTFDEVWFIDNLYNQVPSKSISGHPKPKGSSKPIELISQPENGASVERILSDPDFFKNKEIIIKGRVVKVNRNILDRNWIHIKDGTTFNEKNQITITTTDSVDVGEVLIFNGIVTLEKDFGYGYVYPILVENGTVIRKKN